MDSLHRIRGTTKRTSYFYIKLKNYLLPTIYQDTRGKGRREINPRNRRNIIGNESEKKKKKKSLKGEYFKNADWTLSFRFHGTYISWAEKQGERADEGIACVSVYVAAPYISNPRLHIYLTLLVQMQSAAYVSVKKDSYRRALECNSVCRYSYLALLEFKLDGRLRPPPASTLNRRTSSSRPPSPPFPSITTKGEDVRLRDARQPRSFSSDTFIPFNCLSKGGEESEREGERWKVVASRRLE